MKNNKMREQKETLLLVGEGADEKAFLDYLKSQLAPRGSGVVITIKDAKGKGAKHVIDWTIRQATITQYDKVGVLFDTDTDWTLTVEKKAKQHKICLLKSEPCFEAMMLRMLNKTPELDSKKLKKQFAVFVNNDATDSKNYAEHFDVVILKTMRNAEQAIDQLLTLLKN
jgi:hypothetical protein